MLCSIKGIFKDQRGAVISYFIILVPVMLLMAAIALDLGRVTLLKHQLQAMADAASLAGASGTRAQFLYDSTGTNVTGQILVIDVPTADQYAQDTFDQNIAASGFDKEGVYIDGYQGWPIDANNDGYLDSYHVKITATIKTALIGPLLGMKNITITEQAQSMLKQKPLT